MVDKLNLSNFRPDSQILADCLKKVPAVDQKRL